MHFFITRGGEMHGLSGRESDAAESAELQAISIKSQIGTKPTTRHP